MNSYEARREARRQRLLDRAERLEQESAARFNQAHTMADVIPFGQPILVGHHSEGRDRRYRARIDSNFRKSFELQKMAGEALAKADAVGSAGISPDDPDAVEKLQLRLEELRAEQAAYKAVNAAHARFLKNPASLETSKLTSNEKELVRTYKPAYSWEPHPFPPYRLQNLGANIRRIEQRIKSLSAVQVANAGKENESIELPAYVVVKNFELNRLQLKFPGKPSAAVRTALKSFGFRWSPMEGAWQRMLGGSADYHAIEAEGYIRKAIEKAAQL